MKKLGDRDGKEIHAEAVEVSASGLN